MIAINFFKIYKNSAEILQNFKNLKHSEKQFLSFFPKDSYLGALRLFLRVQAAASSSRSIFRRLGYVGQVSIGRDPRDPTACDRAVIFQPPTSLTPTSLTPTFPSPQCPPTVAYIRCIWPIYGPIWRPDFPKFRKFPPLPYPGKGRDRTGRTGGGGAGAV